MCRAVAYLCAALLTTVDDYISALGIGLDLYRLKKSSAFVRAVTGIDIDVQRMKAEGTVIARGISEG